MKPLPLLLIPSVALLFSACAPGPGGPGYGGPGYDRHDTAYVEGSDQRDRDYDHDGYAQNQSDRTVTNVNEVDVNRTNVNEQTVNRTNVNDRTVNKTNVKEANVKKTSAAKPLETKDHNTKGKEKPTPIP
jgi:hypothetical protein